MSLITVAWAMCASASWMLGLMHLLLWMRDRGSHVFLLSSVMAVSAGASAIIELGLMYSESSAAYAALVRWGNLALSLLLVSMVWFVQSNFGTGRRWLAVIISLLWAGGIVVNFLQPGSLTFAEITELKVRTTSWGEQFLIAQGEVNPWKTLADVASLLILVFVADASIRLWRQGDSRKALVIGGAIILFITIAGIHTPLVDAGLVDTPYMVSFVFLGIVLAMSYELVSEALRASVYAREIRANEARWLILLENVQLAVIGLDANGHIVYTNPFLCELIGYADEALLGQPVTVLIPEADRPEMERRLKQAAVARPRPHSHWTLVCSTGDTRQLDWSTVRLNDADGRFNGVLSVGVDVTDKLKTRRELQQTQRDLGRISRANLLGELASSLAHEINQPLTAILSNAQAAKRFLGSDDPDLDEIMEILDDIVQNDKRAADVISRVRTLVRNDQTDREWFDINAAAKEIIRMLSKDISERNIVLKVECERDRLMVEAGRVEIQQVIMNFLVNAMKAVSEMPLGRRIIRLRTGSRDGAVYTEVRDSGPGIALDILPRVFDAFFTDSDEGLGMGLAISRRIVEAHDGGIRADNVEVGGAVFSFFLPVHSRAMEQDRE